MILLIIDAYGTFLRKYLRQTRPRNDCARSHAHVHQRDAHVRMYCSRAQNAEMIAVRAHVLKKKKRHVVTNQRFAVMEKRRVDLLMTASLFAALQAFPRLVRKSSPHTGSMEKNIGCLR